MDNINQARLTNVGPDDEPRPYLRNGQTTHIPRTALSVCMSIMILVLSACSTTTSTPPPPSAAPATLAPTTAAIATVVPQPTATTAPLANTTSMPQSTLASTAIDPCQLIGSQEASTFTGASYGQGVEGAIPGGIKTCTYGGNTTNIFIVDVGQASDVKTAQAYRDSFLAYLQANAQQMTGQGLEVTQVPNFADGAVIATANISAGGITLNASAIGVLKGTVFFGFSDTVMDGGVAPSNTALQTEATTVLGRLP